jgi:hypothetical protein
VGIQEVKLAEKLENKTQVMKNYGIDIDVYELIESPLPHRQFSVLSHHPPMKWNAQLVAPR